jgi:hypothetical protein
MKNYEAIKLRKKVDIKENSLILHIAEMDKLRIQNKYLKSLPLVRRGQIAVDKRRLIDHCNTLQNCLNKLDVEMKLPSSIERGKIIAKIANEIDLSLQGIEHFELNIPLKNVGKWLK